MHVSRRPRKLTIDFFFRNNSLDLINRCCPRIPRSLSLVISKIVREFIKLNIGDVCEVSSRMAGIERGDALALNQCNRESRFLQEIRCGDAGYARPDHENSDIDILLQRRESFNRRAINPKRNRGHHSANRLKKGI